MCGSIGRGHVPSGTTEQNDADVKYSGNFSFTSGFLIGDFFLIADNSEISSYKLITWIEILREFALLEEGEFCVCLLIVVKWKKERALA